MFKDSKNGICCINSSRNGSCLYKLPYV